MLNGENSSKKSFFVNSKKKNNSISDLSIDTSRKKINMVDLKRKSENQKLSGKPFISPNSPQNSPSTKKSFFMNNSNNSIPEISNNDFLLYIKQKYEILTFSQKLQMAFQLNINPPTPDNLENIINNIPLTNIDQMKLIFHIINTILHESTEI